MQHLISQIEVQWNSSRLCSHTVRSGVAGPCTALGCTALTVHCTALHCTALHCTALTVHCTCTALHWQCTALRCTALYCTVLYETHETPDCLVVWRPSPRGVNELSTICVNKKIIYPVQRLKALYSCRTPTINKSTALTTDWLIKSGNLPYVKCSQ